MNGKWEQFEERLKEMLNDSEAIRKLAEWLKDWRVGKGKEA